MSLPSLSVKRRSGRRTGDSWSFDWGVVDSALLPNLGDELMIADDAFAGCPDGPIDRRGVAINPGHGGGGAGPAAYPGY